MKEDTIIIKLPFKVENKCILFNNEIEKNKLIDIKEIEKTINKDKNSSDKEILFTGESFSNLSIEIQENILSSMHKLYRDGKIKGIRIVTEAKNIDKSIVKMYKKYGVTSIELRVFSTNNYILKRSELDFSYEELKRVSKLIRRKFIKLCFEIMVGLPESTKFDEINVAKQVIDLKPKEVKIYPVLVAKGTKLSIMAAKNEYEALTMVQAIDRCKELIYLFNNKKIKVYVGNYDKFLKENIEISDIYGPYDKEFNRLVESSIWYDMIVEKIKKFNVKVKEVEVKINPNDYENAIGVKNENIEKLKDLYNVDAKIVKDEEIKQGKIEVIIKKQYSDFL